MINYMTLSFITALLSTIYVTVSNPMAEQRNDIPVVVNIPASAGEVRSVKINNQNDIPYQLDDMNGDGVHDEIVMLLDLKPNETRSLTLTLSSAEAKTDTSAPGTYAYIKLNDKNKKYPKINAITYPGDVDNRQMYNSIYGHGAVLEGLYNAIRVYMDNRQSVDLYAKNQPQLELETTGFYTTSEQLDKGYGRDILWAGTSVAMGSFRGWVDGTPATIDSVSTRGQRVVTTGPLRSVIEVTDRNWIYNGRPIDMTQRYTIYKGHRDYEVEVSLKGAPANAIFATGVQKIMNDNEGFIRPDGLAGSWGNNLPDKNMPQVTDTLGLGIYVPSPYLAKTLEDDVNYLTLVKPDRNGKIRYHITAAALRDKCSPRDAKSWFADLEAWRKQLDNPAKINVTTSATAKKKRRK